MHLEEHRTRLACNGPSPDEVTPLAQIALPATPSGCPVGQVALRSWEQGQGFQAALPGFVATLAPETLAAVSQALTRFAGSAEAFVIACPREGQADWLFVDAKGTEPRAQLFIDNALSPAHHHPQVTFAGAPPEPVVAPAPVPPQCAGLANPGWVARFFSTGMMPGPHRQRTWALSRSADRATLVIEEKKAGKSNGAPPHWQCERSTRFEGSVTERGAQLLFTFQDGDGFHEVTCTPRTLRVANAQAVRVPVPSNQEGCNRNRWSPAATVQKRALVCTSKNDPGAGWGAVVFAAPPPGLEQLTLDEDDCWDPADSLRLVPADGGFAPVR